MLTDVVNNGLALVIGLLTGFYFERRSTRSARRDADEAEARNRELTETLRNLRSELVTRDSHAGQVRAVAPQPATDIEREALNFVRTRQDASGRLAPAALRNGLMALGFTAGEVDTAIQTLADRDVLKAVGSGEWEVRA